jgi:WD40 repeat protein
MAKITGLGWLPHSKNLAMAGGERLRSDRPGELRLWQFDKQPPVRTLRLEDQGVWSLAVAEGPTAAYCGGARRAVAWNLTRQEPKVFKQPDPCMAVALSRDGSQMAVAVDRAVKLYDLGRNQEVASLTGHKGRVLALAFSPDGQTLATGSRDRTIRFWPVSGTGPVQPRRIFEWPVGAVYTLAFSPDGMLAAAAGDNGAIFVWDVDE